MAEQVDRGLSQNLDAPGRPESGSEAHHRRISYFMLFRLIVVGVLALTWLAYNQWLVEAHESSRRDWLIGGMVVFALAQTVAFALRLRPSAGALGRRALTRLAAVHTGFDVGLACVCVLLTGGVESDFVFLFLIAVLGAATMGDRRHILAAAAACGLFFFALSLAQLIGAAPLPHEPGIAPDPVAPTVLLLALLKTSAAIALVAILSSYLNTQLLSSVSQLGNLRTLTENIVRSLTSGLLTIDPHRRVVFANPTARELLGRSGELAGRECEALLPGLGRHLDDSGGIRNRFELDVTRADDNREVHLGLSCSPLLDEHGQFLGHVVNFQDVSKLREMERIVRRNERLAALGSLAASVAHEVRNPLAAIAGCAELLESELANDEDQRLIRVIRRESKRLDQIVNELLDYTRPRKPLRARVDLGPALHDFADAVRADPNLAEVELILDIPETAIEAELDLAQLTQVLWNLVRNGAQAMDNVGRLELGVHADSDTGAITIRVRDHGRGIPAADLGRIFEPFFSTKSGGSGIGLALVQRIVEDHGGDIQLSSQVGEGTTVELNFPV